MADVLNPSAQEKYIAANRQDYAEIYPELHFLGAEDIPASEAYRAAILADLEGKVSAICNGSKLYSNKLSPGCKLCSEGKWSCLFINGKCNCDCFYCPTSQDEIGLPTTNNLTFRLPSDYAAYLETFGFGGMSLSGGEPLLTPGRCLGFLKTAKQQLGDKLHTWLYTNGSLVTSDILKQLRDAGLDEIRFDIGAINYSTAKAALAVGIIPNVTVEIPAVPEKLELMQERLIEMNDLGINFLNLHQLRLTAYNFPKLKQRDYTYVHGERITVLESELTALQLIRHGLEQNLELGINYCSFVYKNRYQRAAARGRGSALSGKHYEELTEAGYLRTLVVRSGGSDLAQLVSGLPLDDNQGWELSPQQDLLFCTAQILEQLPTSGLELCVSYAETPVLDQVSYRYPFRELRLPSNRKMVIERRKLVEITLREEQIGRFVHILKDNDRTATNELEQWQQIERYEQLPKGLQAYF